MNRYLSLVPDDAEQWVSLAILHSDAEQYEDAFACYRRAEQTEADSPVLRLNWGLVESRLTWSRPVPCSPAIYLRGWNKLLSWTYRSAELDVQKILLMRLCFLRRSKLPG